MREGKTDFKGKFWVGQRVRTITVNFPKHQAHSYRAVLRIAERMGVTPNKAALGMVIYFLDAHKEVKYTTNKKIDEIIETIQKTLRYMPEENNGTTNRSESTGNKTKAVEAQASAEAKNQ